MCGRKACTLGGTSYKKAVSRALRCSRKSHAVAPANHTGLCLDIDDVRFPEESTFCANYNIAPGQSFPILRRSGKGTLELVHARWGWDAPFCRKGQSIINAVSETLSEKAMFRNHLQDRCLVFVSGFFEWQRTAKGKQPYYLHFNEGLMPIAALMRQEKSGSMAFVLLTTESPADLAWCHHRQPAILHDEAYFSQWLSDESFKNCSGMISPFHGLRWHKVHPMVGNPKNNNPKCLEIYMPSDTAPREEHIVKKRIAQASEENNDSARKRRLITCPICTKLVIVSHAEAHVNQCVDAANAFVVGSTAASSFESPRRFEPPVEVTDYMICPICAHRVPASQAGTHVNACADAATCVVVC